MSGAKPQECVMVGDRIDNDIVPAQKLGFKTIRIKVGLDHKHEEPRSHEEMPDCTIYSIRQLMEMF